MSGRIFLSSSISISSNYAKSNSERSPSLSFSVKAVDSCCYRAVTVKKDILMFKYGTDVNSRASIEGRTKDDRFETELIIPVL